jgi:hypothetical protein
LWADDQIPNTIYLLYKWCSFTWKRTPYSQSQFNDYVQVTALSKCTTKWSSVFCGRLLPFKYSS